MPSGFLLSFFFLEMVSFFANNIRLFTANLTLIVFNIRSLQ